MNESKLVIWAAPLVLGTLMVAAVVTVPHILVPFCSAAIPGAMIAVCLIRLNNKRDSFISIVNAEPEPRPEIPFSKDEEWAAQFELRYHPKIGSWNNKDVAALVFDIFAHDVKNGLDVFALIAKVESLHWLSNEERRQIIEDLIQTTSRVEQ